jgi:hypothetical protein
MSCASPEKTLTLIIRFDFFFSILRSVMFENKMQNFRGSSEGLKGDLLKDFGLNENESH